MSQSLNLPDPVFDALQEAASASGTTPVGWIVAHLPEPQTQPQPMPKKEAKTLADLLEGHVGLVHSGGKERLSENTGEKLTEYLLQKRREGRL
jgi:hypothetical protein